MHKKTGPITERPQSMGGPVNNEATTTTEPLP